jgi:hypothetical protein
MRRTKWRLNKGDEQLDFTYGRSEVPYAESSAWQKAFHSPPLCTPAENLFNFRTPLFNLTGPLLYGIPLVHNRTHWVLI